jgi:HrpA-like RNA helicase
VVVVEPRRIAARARRPSTCARERGGAVGAEVGYPVRFARQGGRDTRSGS